MSHLFTIGRLAKRSGTPAKTIRYYDEAGVLTPSAVSDAGYRLYTEADVSRLESIRALRELGFPLAAIRRMLADKQDSHEMVLLQLEVVESQLRSLQRQAAVLRAALAEKTPNVMRALHLSHAAASLGAAERGVRIERFMQLAAGEKESGDAAVQLRAGVLRELPEELNEQQLEAWIQLSGLLDDAQLLETIRKQQAPFKRKLTPQQQSSFGSEIYGILGEAVGLLREGKTGSDPGVRKLAERWAKLFAKHLGKPFDAKFVRWFKRYAAETNDPSIERFWQLVSVLHGRPGVPPFTEAQSLLIAAL